MTALEKINERIKHLENEKETLNEGQENEVGGSPHQQFLWGQEKQVENELDFLKDLKSNLYSFT